VLENVDYLPSSLLVALNIQQNGNRQLLKKGKSQEQFTRKFSEERRNFNFFNFFSKKEENIFAF
jgi:hypothetical protein